MTQAAATMLSCRDNVRGLAVMTSATLLLMRAPPLVERASARPRPAANGPCVAAGRVGASVAECPFVFEIVHAHQLGLALRAPLPPRVLEAADQLLLLVSTEITVGRRQ